jgi:hypothetical protein
MGAEFGNGEIYVEARRFLKDDITLEEMICIGDLLFEVNDYAGMGRTGPVPDRCDYGMLPSCQGLTFFSGMGLIDTVKERSEC